MTDFGDLFARPVAPPGPSRVTFVCTGNICRSPLAEKVLTARLAERGQNPVVVTSAGLHAVVGSAMDILPAEIARRNGADPSHAAAQLSRSLVDSSSLVLTMTRDQRTELLAEYPSALKRTFTVVEFIRILTEFPNQVPAPDPDAGRSLFDVALDASRNRARVGLTDSDDIEDPYRRSAELHEAVGRRIVELVDLLSTRIAPLPQVR